MNAILRRTARSTSAGTAKPASFAGNLGSGLEAIFAVCVLLGALWLLVSGYA